MRTDVLLDRSDRKIIAVTTQDVGPILDRNAELRAQPQRGDFGRHVASIPNVILVRWLNEEYARGNTGPAHVHAGVQRTGGAQAAGSGLEASAGG